MGMTEEADLGVLIGKAGRRFRFEICAGDVERRMDNGEIGHETLWYFRSRNHFRSSGVSWARDQFTTSAAASLKPRIIIHADVFVVVALDRGHIHAANNVQTLLGLAPYPTISPKQATWVHFCCVMSSRTTWKASRLTMYIGYDGVLHRRHGAISNPRNSPLILTTSLFTTNQSPGAAFRTAPEGIPAPPRCPPA